MEKDIEEKLAGSLTANTTEILPFLPYLLQDLWELGSDPECMIKLIKENIEINKEIKVLDLACGKGSVSVKLSKELDVFVKGIDIILEFISYAEEKAKEYQVEDKCIFETNEINKAIEKEKEYDIVILGAVGDVLGDPKTTLEKLKKVIKENGYILLDDAYLTGKQEEVKYQNYEYLTLEEWNQIFDELNLKLISMVENEEDICDEVNDYNNKQIKKRAEELIEKHSEKKELFEGYIQSQLDECEDLESNIVGVTFLLQSK